jgi:hypothetical protein
VIPGTLDLKRLTSALKLPALALTVAPGQPNAGEHRFTKELVSIGSLEGNDLQLRDPSVSRHHVEISSRPEGCMIRDLGATNGTFVDGVRIREAFLHGGATLLLGKTRVGFTIQKDQTTVELLPASSFGRLIGQSASMRRTFAVLAKLAARDVTVLVQGESGTGKELVARALHEESSRKGGPFVVVDCGALPFGLMESEILGHERGAFTGAIKAREGAFERAHGGTLVLDEIGELPLELQPKLLRALEQREVTRVGGGSPRRVRRPRGRSDPPRPARRGEPRDLP